MRRKSLACVIAVLISAVVYVPALAASDPAQDTDARMVDAKVVEVNDKHISVIARTGVEHVVATNAKDTRVSLKGKRIAFKKLRVGDIVTVELDATKQLKYARRIVVADKTASTLASNRD
ncbi:MAG TPA: hypothetical protein VEX60_03640 [Pyrinomonadaceae bacterium]|nr:hypothetical protein [Pyrinomonadaceae bacterium]